MKQLSVMLVVLAVSAFAACPVLAKGGHSGGHARHSSGRAHHPSTRTHKSAAAHATHKAKSAKPTHLANQPETTTATVTGAHHATNATVVSHRGSYNRGGYGRRNYNRNRRNYARGGRPSFVAGPDQFVGANSGPQTVAPWATRISAGSRQGQQGQQGQGGLQFQVTNNSNAALFTAPPSVSPSGVLSFRPAAGQAGTATVTVVLRSGTGSSAPHTFHITVH